VELSMKRRTKKKATGTMDALLGVSWASGRLIWSMKNVGHRGRRKVIADREFQKLVENW
jgi:hypothetical protein